MDFRVRNLLPILGMDRDENVQKIIIRRKKSRLSLHIRRKKSRFLVFIRRKKSKKFFSLEISQKYKVVEKWSNVIVITFLL